MHSENSIRIVRSTHSFSSLQCGFCTPGMVMTAYSTLTANKGEVSAAQMEKALDGNICRCTGYRYALFYQFQATFLILIFDWTVPFSMLANL